MARKKTPEGYVKSAVEQLLNTEGIENWRMNAGDRFGSHNGKKWRIKGHPAGTPDILAAPLCGPNRVPTFLWLELKAPGKKPTEEQLAFADRVRNQGHHWLCVDSIDPVREWLKENRAT